MHRLATIKAAVTISAYNRKYTHSKQRDKVLFSCDILFRSQIFKRLNWSLKRANVRAVTFVCTRWRSSLKSSVSVWKQWAAWNASTRYSLTSSRQSKHSLSKSPKKNHDLTELSQINLPGERGRRVSVKSLLSLTKRMEKSDESRRTKTAWIWSFSIPKSRLHVNYATLKS